MLLKHQEDQRLGGRTFKQRALRSEHINKWLREVIRLGGDTAYAYYECISGMVSPQSNIRGKKSNLRA